MPKHHLAFRSRQNFLLTGVVLAATGALVVAAIAPLRATAATRTVEASLVSRQPALLTVPTRRSVTVTLKIKNLSKSVWRATGSEAVHLHLAKESSGVLRHRWWKTSDVARLKTAVPAGGTATFRVPVTAPKGSGYYEETFALYRGSRRITGGTITLGAIVGAANERHLAASVTPAVDLALEPGTEQQTPISVTNNGRFVWNKGGFGAVQLVPIAATTGAQTFRSLSWVREDVAASLPVATLPYAATAQLQLPLKAPTTPGTYAQDFALAATGIGRIPGSRVRVTITVPEPKPPFLPTDPKVRVGLFSQTTDPTAVIKATGEAKLTALDGTVLVPNLVDVQLSKVGSLYHYVSGTAAGDSTQPLRVDAPATTILEITSWENRPSWNKQLNDNAVRGTIEFRMAANGKTWVINELPVDAYLYGLAETAGSDALEFRKALIVAARSYALFHAAKKTRHGDENYDLNATTDQVYRGYNHERRSPSVKEAVDATKGVVLFHAAARSELNRDGIALGAYFACTDGRTRSFEEVFGGDGVRTPYLVSVPDPDGICSNQRYLRGLDGNHMVGLSAMGARALALKGKLYDEILRAYYTGITVQQYYGELPVAAPPATLVPPTDQSPAAAAPPPV